LHGPARRGRAIEASRAPFARYLEVLPTLLPPHLAERVARDRWRLVDAGSPEDLAERHALQGLVVHAPNVVARAFLLVGERTPIDRLHERIDQIAAPSRWHRLAVQSLHDDLLGARRQIVERVLAEAGGPVDAAVEGYLGRRVDDLASLERVLRGLALEEGEELAAATVAVRQVAALVPQG
ncbi:MAG: hypothetical protein ACKOKE_07825, partial [Actinomycetota bacterium]